jgi:hypothetical protein
MPEKIQTSEENTTLQIQILNSKIARLAMDLSVEPLGFMRTRMTNELIAFKVELASLEELLQPKETKNNPSKTSHVESNAGSKESPSAALLKNNYSKLDLTSMIILTFPM